MISTFQQNRHFRKVSVNKTFMYVQEQKKAMSTQQSAYFPSSVKSPLIIQSALHQCNCWHNYWGCGESHIFFWFVC